MTPKPSLLIFDISGTLQQPDGELYAGALEVLEQCAAAGYQLALATNLGRGSMRRFIQDSGLEELVSAAKSADDAPFKPHPEMLKSILLETATAPGAALMIGDTPADMHMAQAAGTLAGAACWGHTDTSLLLATAPDFVLPSISALSKLLQLE